MSTDNNPKQSPDGDNNSCGFFITQGSPLFVVGLERSVFPLTRFLGPEEQPLSEHRRGQLITVKTFAKDETARKYQTKPVLSKEVLWSY